MPLGYKNEPISGFTGYIPGAKWQVGSRYVAGSRENSNFEMRNSANTQPQELKTQTSNSASTLSPNYAGGSGSHEMRNYSEMSNDELRERMMKMQMDMQNLQMAMNMHQPQTGGGNIQSGSVNFGAQDERMDRRTEFEDRLGQGQGQDKGMKQRSKSMPRRIENNPFDGIESGWWSKGEVKRNQERREIANGGQMVSGGNWSQRPPSRQRGSRKQGGTLERYDAEDIPAAGYSGHIQGLRQLGIGKPFNVAAKQAKKEYIERRRTHSGSQDLLNGRGTQFSEEELSANAVKLPANRF